MKKFSESLWIVLTVLAIVCVVLIMLVKKGGNLEGVKQLFSSIDVEQLSKQIPALAELLEQSPEFAEFARGLGHILDEDAKFLKQNPEFIEYLQKNPGIVKTIINDTDVRRKVREIFEVFMSEKAQNYYE